MEKIDVYQVYAIIDPSSNKPLYIGVGKPFRSKTHVNKAKYAHYVLLKDIKTIMIMKRLSEGLKPFDIILRDNLSKQDALQLEIQLIKEYGRIDNGTGILTNRTDGGQWGLREPKPEEWKQKMRIIQKNVQNNIDVKNKKSKALKGQKRTLAQIENIRNSQLLISARKSEKVKGGLNPSAKKVMIHNVIYGCIRDAEKALNKTRYWLRKDPTFKII